MKYNYTFKKTIVITPFHVQCAGAILFGVLIGFLVG